MEKNGRQNRNVGGQGGSHQHWSAIVPPPPSPPPTNVQTKLQPTFQTSFKRTTQWLKEP